MLRPISWGETDELSSLHGRELRSLLTPTVQLQEATGTHQKILNEAKLNTKSTFQTQDGQRCCLAFVLAELV